MANQCFLIAQIALVIKKRNKGTTNKQTKKNQGKKKRKMGIIVPTMNHYPRTGQEGDLEFSAR